MNRILENKPLEDALLQLSCFEVEQGVMECHAIIHVTNAGETFAKQTHALVDAYQLLKQRLPDAVPVMRRVYLSDAANQQAQLCQMFPIGNDGVATSVVEQPPLDGTKIAMWVWLQTQVKQGVEGVVKHGAYQQHFTAGNTHKLPSSEGQTFVLFTQYADSLRQQGLSLANNCIRTWLFVQNVDVNYAGVVKARNDVFDKEQLTCQTHFIASTGIGGRHADPGVFMQMDAYAVGGVQQEQIHYLYAPTHLNNTAEYGVRFERGTYVDYGDRRSVFISGTASINNKGEVVYLGDIRQQTQRMWENVETLLAEADCSFQDVCHMIVYLRDVADYQVVKMLFEARFPSVPKVIVLAPVCRPGWLIEMECMALKGIHTHYPCF